MSAQRRQDHHALGRLSCFAFPIIPRRAFQRFHQPLPPDDPASFPYAPKLQASLLMGQKIQATPSRLRPEPPCAARRAPRSLRDRFDQDRPPQRQAFPEKPTQVDRLEKDPRRLVHRLEAAPAGRHGRLPGGGRSDAGKQA
jgi:hypothetical protein